jgi:hypothetical protein
MYNKTPMSYLSETLYEGDEAMEAIYSLCPYGGKSEL